MVAGGEGEGAMVGESSVSDSEPKEFRFNGWDMRTVPGYDWENEVPELKPMTSIADLGKLLDMGNKDAALVVNWLVSKLTK